MMGILFYSLTAFFFSDELETTEVKQRRLEAPIQKVYIPTGFDDNDVAQFVVEGEFPNTCFSLGRASVRPYIDRKVILFYVEAFEQQTPCLTTRVHFHKVVDIGILPAGIYKIYSFKNLSKLVGSLVIRPAPTATIDNFPYAPVEAIFLHNDTLGYRRLLTMTGFFTNSCMKFYDSSVRVLRTSSDIIEVFPIIKLSSPQKNCIETLVPFFKTIEMPDNIPSGKYLFHVRAMNGSSMNKVDYLEMDVDP